MYESAVALPKPPFALSSLLQVVNHQGSFLTLSLLSLAPSDTKSSWCHTHPCPKDLAVLGV